MKHKVGDRVRIKQLGGNSKFSGELGYIDDYVSENNNLFVVNLDNKAEIPDNRITLTSNEFINLEHLQIQNLGIKDIYSPSQELTNSFADKPKQINFNFDLPIETYECDLHFEIEGKEYSVMITRIN